MFALKIGEFYLEYKSYISTSAQHIHHISAFKNLLNIT